MNTPSFPCPAPPVARARGSLGLPLPGQPGLLRRALCMLGFPTFKFTSHRGPSPSPRVSSSSLPLPHAGDLNRKVSGSELPIQSFHVEVHSTFPSAHVGHSRAHLGWIQGEERATRARTGKLWAPGDGTACPEKDLTLDGEWATGPLPPRTGALTRRSGKARTDHDVTPSTSSPAVQVPGRPPGERKSLLPSREGSRKDGGPACPVLQVPLPLQAPPVFLLSVPSPELSPRTQSPLCCPPTRTRRDTTLSSLRTPAEATVPGGQEPRPPAAASP